MSRRTSYISWLCRDRLVSRMAVCVLADKGTLQLSGPHKISTTLFLSLGSRWQPSTDLHSQCLEADAPTKSPDICRSTGKYSSICQQVFAVPHGSSRHLQPLRKGSRGIVSGYSDRTCRRKLEMLLPSIVEVVSSNRYRLRISPTATLPYNTPA